jgi:septal ring factor EnvC (AmiA/AmiB activator)
VRSRADSPGLGPGLGLIAATAALAVVAAPLEPSYAQDKPDRGALEKVERNLDASRDKGAKLTKRMAALGHAIQALREKLVRAAQRAQFREAELLRTEIELAELEARERKSRAGFREAQRQLARLIAAMQRIRRHPPGAFAIRFDRADDAIRSTVVLRALIPKIEERAAILRNRLRTFAALKARIGRRQAQLRKQRDGLAQIHTQLAGLIARQSELLQQTQRERDTNAARIAALTRKARSLRDLVERLDRESEKTEPKAPAPRADALTRPALVRPFGKARGHVTMPVAGRVVRRFGQTDEFGLEVRGLQIEARKGAQVVAPYDGQIVFAGPFRSYGQILIIRHSGGYHSLVAGLTRIYVVNKQWVLAGEPVGVMGGRTAAGPRLYLEIRRKGRPINPLPWLAADKRKVNG